jgi:hypothetical protein
MTGITSGAGFVDNSVFSVGFMFTLFILFGVFNLFRISWISLSVSLAKETEIKNGYSRETGNIGHSRHKRKTNKTKNTTQYVLDTIMHKQTKYNKAWNDSYMCIVWDDHKLLQ